MDFRPWRGTEEVSDFGGWVGWMSSISQTLQERDGVTRRWLGMKLKAHRLQEHWIKSRAVASLVPTPLWFSLDSIISQSIGGLSQASPHRLGQAFPEVIVGNCPQSGVCDIKPQQSTCLWVRCGNETKHPYRENSLRFCGQEAAFLDSVSLEHPGPSWVWRKEHDWTLLFQVGLEQHAGRETILTYFCG